MDNSEVNSETMSDSFEITDVNTASNNGGGISSILYQAIKDNKIDDIKVILKDKTLVNAPVQTSGSLAGYTPLHIACMEKNVDLVKMLVLDYHANVNVIAKDGTQPIHLACIVEHVSSMQILIKANANINATLGQDIFLKYEKDKEWCSDFGDKITLVTFATLYDRFRLAIFLILNGANVNIKGNTNKTLLMYAWERDEDLTAHMIVRFTANDREYLNSRDDYDHHAVHYILHPKKYGDFRYDGKQTYMDEFKVDNLLGFYFCNLDIYATINDDPNTMLLNIAAYRSSSSVLKRILPFYENIRGSKALYFATLPIEDPQKFFRIDPTVNEEMQWVSLLKNRIHCLELILKDLINRLTCGLPVPEEEKKLLDKLIATDNTIRKIVHNYQQEFIHGRLKNLVFKYGDKSMTFYDFILLCVNNKKLLLFLRDEKFLKAAKYIHVENDVDYTYFKHFCSIRVERAIERIELLNKLKTVKLLRKVIPLPYEYVLNMIEFLNNEDLKTFINSFLSI